MPEKDPHHYQPGGSNTGEDASAETELRLALGEERVVLSKREVEKGAARISLRTQTESVTVSEPLRSERVEVKRVPVDRIVAKAPEPRSEGDTTIIPVVEEVLVVQYRILEEIHITRHVNSVDHTETVVLRKQEAVVTDADAPPGEAPAADGTS